MLSNVAHKLVVTFLQHMVKFFTNWAPDHDKSTMIINLLWIMRIAINCANSLQQNLPFHTLLQRQRQKTRNALISHLADNQSANYQWPWKRRPGRPCNNWLEQISQDFNTYPQTYGAWLSNTDMERCYGPDWLHDDDDDELSVRNNQPIACCCTKLQNAPASTGNRSRHWL